MTSPLDQIAPAFMEMAHRIVWATAATVAPDGRPWTRILHPLWTWDGSQLTGLIATAPAPLKRAHLETTPNISLTYWQPNQDTCSANCAAEWDLSPEGRQAGWNALATAPAPVGYDPSIVPGWDAPTSDSFAILRLTPWWLRVMPGTAMLEGKGDVATWSAVR